MRKHHYKLKTDDEAELAVTTFLNLLVVLVPFLLITAVFSRMTIVELNLPSAVGGPTPDEIGFRPEVIVREDGIEVTNGADVIAAMPKVNGEYDLASLSDLMLALKQDYASVEDMSVLLEPQIPYDWLIRVMDAVRTVEIPDPAAATGFTRVALFTAISVGEAP
jgi:biopolymer transport protein ExbD